MGTNYYAVARLCTACQHKERYHIGKASLGWVFKLHVIPELGLNLLDDWKKFLHDKEVVDEFGGPRSLRALYGIIENRNGYFSSLPPRPSTSWADCYEKNQAEAGPRQLIRSKVDGVRCIGHAPDNGTWEYILGEFS